MLKWFRSRASAIAPALVLSLAALAFPHVGDSAHDADGEFASYVVHTAAGHAVGKPSSSDEPLHHCAICHAARSFRPLTQINVLAAAPVNAAGFKALDLQVVATAEIAAQPPLRAPPSSPALA
jgi:hypothetical protein